VHGDRCEAHTARALNVVIRALEFEPVKPQNQWVGAMFLTTLTYFMDNFMNNAFSVIRHKMYSEVPNMPLEMKEDVAMSEVGEEFGSSFNELSGSDDINEEANGGGVVLCQTFVDVRGILDVKTGGLDKSLVLYFF